MLLLLSSLRTLMELFPMLHHHQDPWEEALRREMAMAGEEEERTGSVDVVNLVMEDVEEGDIALKRDVAAVEVFLVVNGDGEMFLPSETTTGEVEVEVGVVVRDSAVEGGDTMNH